MVQKMRSEEHTSELQSRVDISYAVFCLKKKLAVAMGLLASSSALTQVTIFTIMASIAMPDYWNRRAPCWQRYRHDLSSAFFFKSRRTRENLPFSLPPLSCI